MTRHVGVYSRSLPGDDRLRQAHDLGLDGVIFNSIAELSPTLDRAELADVKARANALGLALTVGVGRIHPHSDSPPDAAVLERMVAASVEQLGCRELWFSVAGLADRFSTDPSWPKQLAAVRHFLRGFAPILRDHGARLNLKTHEEITSREIVDLIEAVGPDVLGCSLDPVNLLVRLEDPLAATRRLAPHVHHVHVDDAATYFVDEGIERKLCLMGEGVLPWPEIIAEVAANDPWCWIELHRGQFTMPVFEDGWLVRDGVPLADFAASVRLAVEGERRIRAGAAPPPQDQPWLRFDSALRFLRP